MNLLSIDPGAVHCAFAVWELHADPATEGSRWKCMEAHETGPDEFLDMFRRWTEHHDYDQVAIEEFRLQGNKALAQTGSTMGTSEVIGVVKHLCRWTNTPLRIVRPLDRDATFTRMKAVKFAFPKDQLGHMKAAICVGAVATDWRAINFREGDGVG